MPQAAHGAGSTGSDRVAVVANDEPWPISAARFNDDEVDPNWRDRKPTTVGQRAGLEKMTDGGAQVPPLSPVERLLG